MSDRERLARLTADLRATGVLISPQTMAAAMLRDPRRFPSYRHLIPA